MSSRSAFGKLFRVFLSVVMVVTLQVQFPRTVLADEGGDVQDATSVESNIAEEGGENAGTALSFDAQTLSSDDAVAEEVVEEKTITPPFSILPSGDRLLESYMVETAETVVQEALYGVEDAEDSVSNLPPTSARYWRLGDSEKKAYLAIRDALAGVAAGTQDSTVLTFDFADVFTDDVLNARYTANDLGIMGDLTEEQYIEPPEAPVAGNYTVATEEAKNAVATKYTLATNSILGALLCDYPQSFFWFDKTVGLSVQKQSSVIPEFDPDTNTVSVYCVPESKIVFRFAVASEYAPNPSYVYTFVNKGQKPIQTDMDKITSIKAAIEKAAAVVASADSKTDMGKLAYYKDQICDKVTYNKAAADNASTPYGDPWQLVYVFDGDESTNVVCEGYAKAFKYLSDLTTFENNTVSTHIVTGEMTGGTGAGGHMWNLVSMDGANYLVDVTNCDSGSAGYPGKLFMRGEETNDNNVTANTYVFSKGFTKPISYTYDEETIALFAEAELQLAATDYMQQEEQQSIDISNATISGVEDKYHTGSAITQTPTVTLTVDGATRTLTKGTDYELSYENNVNVGTATMTVTGIGAYTGTVSTSFAILESHIHDWGTVVYTWSSDNKTCTATRVCKDDAVHKETETVNAASKVTTASTYTTKGKTTYTATFANTAFKTQTKTVEDIAPLPTVALKSVTVSNVVRDGNTINFRIAVIDANGKTVSSGAYTKALSADSSMGTLTITANAGSGYTGTVKTTFAIPQSASQDDSAAQDQSAGQNGVAAVTTTPTPAQAAATKALAGKAPTTMAESTLAAIATDKSIPKIAAGKISTSANTSKKTMTVRLPKVAGAKNYLVAYKKATAKKWTYYTTGGKTTYTIKKMAAGGLYQFKVAAVKGGKRGAWSSVSYRYFKGVTKLKVAPDTKSLTVSWAKNTGATGYQVRYSTAKSMSGAKTVTVKGKNAIKKVIKKLKKGKTYYVQVRPMKAYKGKTYVGILSATKKVKVK